MRSYKVMPRAQVTQFLRPVVLEGILRSTKFQLLWKIREE